MPPAHRLSPWLRVHGLRDDERGSFMVLEAILVALLVLTAILFFTSVQRPSTGADQGGLDLGQVAADTLSILQVRSFNGDDFDTWITDLAQGDSATGCPATPTATTCPTATAIDDFLGEVLPTGARYSLRIDNGVSTLPLLPLGSTQEPHGARAAQVLFLPAWGSYASQAVTDGAAPGEVLSSGSHPVLERFTDPDEIDCIKAPNGGTGTIGAKGPGAISWTSLWQTADQRVPEGALYGTWVGYPNTDCTGVATYAKVWSPRFRTVTGVTAYELMDPLISLSCPSACFSSLDLGLPVIGPNIPAGARIASVTADGLSAGLTAAPTVAGANLQVQLPSYSPYLPYGLQLVVWFGA